MTRALLRGALLLATLLLAPLDAHADGQWSARLGMGGGASMDRTRGASEGIFELHLAADVMFGGARPNVVRVGPLFDLRTSDFATAEGALGVTLSLPLLQGFPLTISAGTGAASRRANPDALFVLGRVAFGYHPYNYLAPYAYALGVYADVRRDLGAINLWQVTGGVEIDLEFLVAIPFMFITQWLTREDPEELAVD